MAVKIEGSCDPRFARVKDVFADSFAHGIEVGADVLELDLAVTKGWLLLDRSGTFVKFTPAGAELFA